MILNIALILVIWVVGVILLEWTLKGRRMY